MTTIVKFSSFLQKWKRPNLTQMLTHDILYLPYTIRIFNNCKKLIHLEIKVSIHKSLIRSYIALPISTFTLFLPPTPTFTAFTIVINAAMQYKVFDCAMAAYTQKENLLGRLDHHMSVCRPKYSSYTNQFQWSIHTTTVYNFLLTFLLATTLCYSTTIRRQDCLRQIKE
jgi:hypothetical protein